jgi:hypothetical protein
MNGDRSRHRQGQRTRLAATRLDRLQQRGEHRELQLFQTGRQQLGALPLRRGRLEPDGRPDVIVSDDGQDSYRYNTGIDGLGRATFGPLKTYQFLTGSDDGFAGNCYIVDLNNDGWPTRSTATSTST